MHLPVESARDLRSSNSRNGDVKKFGYFQFLSSSLILSFTGECRREVTVGRTQQVSPVLQGMSSHHTHTVSALGVGTSRCRVGIASCCGLSS